MNLALRAQQKSVLPREAGAASLDVVIAIMAFLAALSLCAVLIAQRTAQDWRRGLAGKLTVQVLPPARGPVEPALARETAAAVQVLKTTRGIFSVHELSEAKTERLVEPWLGKGALVADLPLPRLIDASVVPGRHVDLVALRHRLKTAAPDGYVDDHRHWLARLSRLADTIMWSAYGVLGLIAIATAATAAFATRAGLSAHHDIVELLHQMGAHGGFIASAFDRHYLRTAFFASLVGAVLAAIVFAAAGGLEYVGLKPMPFLPPLALSMSQLTWLVLIPVFGGAIAWATARLSVLAALRNIY